MKRILILTLYSGENEFEDCKKSIEMQEYTNWEHITFSFLPNKKAHDTLYGEIMKRRDEFDLFMKLDADMVFQNRAGLGNVVKLFDEDPNLDHIQLALHDCFTNSMIMGVHTFSNQGKWRVNHDKLYVDYAPKIPGIRKNIWKNIAHIYHSPNPSPYQAFHFGVHRGMKIFQPGRSDFSNGMSQTQWKLLKKVWKNFLRTRDYRLGFSVLGAHLVMMQMLEACHNDYYQDSELQEIFSALSHLRFDELYSLLRFKWENPFIREYAHKKRVLPRYFRGAPFAFFKSCLKNIGRL